MIMAWTVPLSFSPETRVHPCLLPLWRSSLRANMRALMRVRARRGRAHLTDLQLGVGLAQAPVDAAVAVCLLKQHVQNVSDCLSLVHHQCLGAAVTHQHLHYQLREAAGSFTLTV